MLEDSAVRGRLVLGLYGQDAPKTGTCGFGGTGTCGVDLSYQTIRLCERLSEGLTAAASAALEAVAHFLRFVRPREDGSGPSYGSGLFFSNQEVSKGKRGGNGGKE